MIAKRFLAFGFFFFCWSPLHAVVHHSSSLGWKAGEDVSNRFKEIFEQKIVGAGDEIVLEQTYRIRGTYQFPDDFTLAAVKGAGFDVTDAVKDNNKPFLLLGRRNTLRNLTITYLNTPAAGPFPLLVDRGRLVKKKQLNRLRDFHCR